MTTHHKSLKTYLKRNSKCAICGKPAQRDQHLLREGRDFLHVRCYERSKRP